MKTNVVMRSTDRKLFGVTVRQETKTGLLNLTDLQDAYNLVRPVNGWSEKNINDILNRQTNIERIFYILESQHLVNTCFNVFTKEVEKEGVIRLLKRLGAYKMSGLGARRSVACDPYIWVMVAMELNPMLYAKIMTWLTDSLILNRIEAGDFYKGFSRAIAKFGPDYVRIAKALNYIVFNSHAAGIRNTATKAQLTELADLEKNLTFSVGMGDINSQEELIKRLKAIWNRKWNQKNLPS